MTFHKAVKYGAKLRLALAGPAGSGKTYTALTLATVLADGGGVALIDTEHGSASKYADLFSFDTLQLETFHPNKYIEAIHEAEAAGYAVLVIDSLSHAWSGQGEAGYWRRRTRSRGQSIAAIPSLPGMTPLPSRTSSSTSSWARNYTSLRPCALRWITSLRREPMARRCRARLVWRRCSVTTFPTSSMCSARSRATIR